MQFSKFNFKDQKVLVRVDFNVPIKGGKITDDSRIKKALPTINHILSCDPKQIIIISHLGRPKGKVNKKYSMKKPASRLSHLLKKRVYFEKNSNLRKCGSHQTELLETTSEEPCSESQLSSATSQD